MGGTEIGYTYDDEKKSAMNEAEDELPMPIELDTRKPLPMPMTVSDTVPLPALPGLGTCALTPQCTANMRYEQSQNNGSDHMMWIIMLVAGIAMMAAGAMSLMIFYNYIINVVLWGVGLILGIIGMRKYADIYAMNHVY